MLVITQCRLMEVLNYNQYTGVFIWIVGGRNQCNVGDVAGTIHKTKHYRYISIDGRKYLAQRLAFLYMKGYCSEHRIDHRDRVRDNNKWLNLREASGVCNMRNCKVPSNNVSGVKGVSLKYTGKWQVQVGLDNKRKYVGQSEDFTKAVAMRLAAEQCLRWSECDTSSPAYSFMLRYLDTKSAV